MNTPALTTADFPARSGHDDDEPNEGCPHPARLGIARGEECRVVAVIEVVMIVVEHRYVIGIPSVE